jgi:hypothetical protein
VPWCGKVWLPSKHALNIKENCLIVPFLYNCYLFVCFICQRYTRDGECSIADMLLVVVVSGYVGWSPWTKGLACLTSPQKISPLNNNPHYLSNLTNWCTSLSASRYV